MTDAEKPKLLIPIESWRKIMAYTDLAEGEITGFADVDYDSEQENFIMKEVYLIDQIAEAAEVEMNEEQIAAFMLKRIEAGATQMPRIWWHSHVNMEVFFSGTDDATISEFKNDSYTISLVVNKNRDMKAQLNLWKPFTYMSPIEVRIMFEYTDIPQEIIDEVKEKVKDPPPIQQNTYYNYHDKKKKEKEKGEEGKESLLRLNKGAFGDDLDDEYAEYAEPREKESGWLPLNKELGLEWLKEEREDLWISFDEDMHEYVFWHMQEGIEYKDLNGQYQHWASEKHKEQMSEMDELKK